MGVILDKGEVVNLSKQTGGRLTKITIGLGWQERSTNGDDYDLDASVLVLGQNGKVLGDSWLVFYNNLTSPDGAVQHQGDELTGGSGNSDDEQILVDLTAIDSDAVRLIVAVTIHDADKRNQSFGDIRRSYVRIVNQANDTELARYDLTEDASGETAMVFAEIYRDRNEWIIKASGEGVARGLYGLCKKFGVRVG